MDYVFEVARRRLNILHYSWRNVGMVLRHHTLVLAELRDLLHVGVRVQHS